MQTVDRRRKERTKNKSVYRSYQVQLRGKKHLIFT